VSKGSNLGDSYRKERKDKDYNKVDSKQLKLHGAYREQKSFVNNPSDSSSSQSSKVLAHASSSELNNASQSNSQHQEEGKQRQTTSTFLKENNK
jgi:hypothetical protein